MQEVQDPRSLVHSRMFAPSLGIAEDPATGGASGPLGCYLMRHGLLPAGETIEMISEQGFEMGRPSFIRIVIEQLNGSITGVRVGGQRHFMGQGYLNVA